MVGRLAQLGLVKMLNADGSRPWQVMAEALHRLPEQPAPSAASIPGLLDGLETVHERIRHLLEDHDQPSVLLAQN